MWAVQKTVGLTGCARLPPLSLSSFDPSPKIFPQECAALPLTPPSMHPLRYDAICEKTVRFAVLTYKYKIGVKAVTRVRARRRIRAAATAALNNFCLPGFDVVFVANPPCLYMAYPDLLQEIM